MTSTRSSTGPDAKSSESRSSPFKDPIDDADNSPVSRVTRGVRRRTRVAAAVRFVRSLDGPVSDHYGFDRGTPVDRVYIERFLEHHAGDVRGRVLEVKDSVYTTRFGGDQVTAAEVLDLNAGNTKATIVADLQEPGSLPAGAYDCIILTQVMQFLRPQHALPNLYGALRVGGVLLMSVPVLCRLETRPPDLWRLTADGLGEMLSRELPAEASIETEQHGNAVAAVGFLLGLATEDLAPATLQCDDLRYPLVSFARVKRP